MDQRLTFTSGKIVESHDQRWSLYSDGGVSFERRINVTQGENTELRSEGLVVRYGEKPIILIDPDTNCFYERVASGLSAPDR
jgi:hypothetical protein